MIVALHDADNTGYPNLALMKISAWHKQQGDTVGIFHPFAYHDKLYSSKVFTYSDTYPIQIGDKCDKGGTGWDISRKLSSEIEHICPDYKIYGTTYSMGFLTRGCIRRCSWCFVPDKEGDIKAHAEIGEFLRHDSVVLMDNNVLAHEHGIKEIEKMGKMNVKVDFNQGLDARLIDDSVAKLLSKLRWKEPLRLACDTIGQMEYVNKAVQILRWNNVSPTRYFVYVLVKEIDDALDRIRFLKGLNLVPFAQSYRDKENNEPTYIQKQLCRWVNIPKLFNKLTWDEFKASEIKGHTWTKKEM